MLKCGNGGGVQESRPFAAANPAHVCDPSAPGDAQGANGLRGWLASAKEAAVGRYPNISDHGLIGDLYPPYPPAGW